MKWKDRAFDTLQSKFPNKIFTTSDAYKILNSKEGYSKGTVYRVLHDLLKMGLVERLGRGIYRIKTPRAVKIVDSVVLSDKVIVELVPGSLATSRDLLRNKGIEFMITGASLFYRYIHHLPKRLLHLIYVTKGAGEFAVTTLREAEFRALLNPSSNEISLALKNFTEREIFLIREFSKLLGNTNGNACLERALVDLYFETTRKRIPFPKEEVSRIFLKLLRDEQISLSRLFMFAKRRGIKEEMKAIAKFIEPNIPIRVKGRSKYVRDFISTMEKAEWR